MLKFGTGNSKLHELAKTLGLNKTEVVAFDLPAGYTCPMADICKTYANRQTGKITDGKNSTVRCYASLIEARFPASRRAHWYNFDLLRNSSNMVELIQESLPKQTKIVRIHASGDYYSMDYYNAWLQVAINNPTIMFFGYTKILPLVSMPKPDNFKLVYSYGGKMDNQLSNEPTAYIVNSAKDTKLDTVCQNNPADDYFKIISGQSFALALHGQQKAK